MKKLLKKIVDEIDFFLFWVWLKFNAVEIEEGGATNGKN